jgi:5-methylcytosine-specific restriction endonuclease McrA
MMTKRNISKAKFNAVRRAVFERDNHTCTYCGWREGGPAPMRPDGGHVLKILELDHIIPYSKGGPFTEANLQALCTQCNVRKGAKTA